MSARAFGSPPGPTSFSSESAANMTAVEKVGDAEKPDVCPFCGTTVEPVLGALIGRPSVGCEVSPEPWRGDGDLPGMRRSASPDPRRGLDRHETGRGRVPVGRLTRERPSAGDQA